MDMGIIEIPAAAIGAGALSAYIMAKINTSTVKRLDKQVNGNGQEGLMTRFARIEEKVDSIKDDMKEIKKAVSK